MNDELKNLGKLAASKVKKKSKPQMKLMMKKTVKPMPRLVSKLERSERRPMTDEQKEEMMEMMEKKTVDKIPMEEEIDVRSIINNSAAISSLGRKKRNK